MPKIVIALMLVLVGLVSPVAAEEDDLARTLKEAKQRSVESLAGIREVSVSPILVPLGKPRPDLQKKLEAKLAESGITVLDLTKPKPSGVDYAMLDLLVEAHAGVLSVQLHVKQPAVLARLPHFKTLSTTWMEAQVADSAKNVDDKAMMVLLEFIADYRAANPKKP